MGPQPGCRRTRSWARGEGRSVTRAESKETRYDAVRAGDAGSSCRVRALPAGPRLGRSQCGVTPLAAPRLEQGLAGSPEQVVVPTSWVWEHWVPSTSLGLWCMSQLHVPPAWVQLMSVQESSRDVKADAWADTSHRVSPPCACGDGRWSQGGVDLGWAGTQTGKRRGDTDTLRGSHITHRHTRGWHATVLGEGGG